ncbi:hypothetical protein EV426DRAFT_536430, partial [Tirmania nivea]
DLSTPRPQWYLDINPRGLVPTLRYGSEFITEFSIVSEVHFYSKFVLSVHKPINPFAIVPCQCIGPKSHSPSINLLLKRSFQSPREITHQYLQH